MIFEKIYQFYSRKIYPSVSSIRGATRLKFLMKELSLNKLEKVNMEECQNPFAEEWDNLIIIDSCRQDLFQKITGYQGSRYSLGSATPEYIEKNFSNGDFSNYVYIAGSPYFSDKRFEEITGREPLEVFHTVFKTFETGWSDGLVKPEKTIEEALTAKKLFPQKKLVIHFMPPHYPFVTEIIDTDEQIDPWNLAENGKVAPEKVISAYEDNIEYIEPFIDELVSGLNGKSILTSDHGNFIGEAGTYGHPKYREEKAVKKVPWIEF